MNYASPLPFSALMVFALMHWAMAQGWIPPGEQLLSQLQAGFDQAQFLLVFAIILLEAIVYVGFYFPGQFFAVLIVVLADPDWMDILMLTLMMVAGATLASLINFELGRRLNWQHLHKPKQSIGALLVAMIHINSLAFFMVYQGAQGRSRKIVALAGLLNLPYYLLLIGATSLLSEEVMQVAENPWILAWALGIWLVTALSLDGHKWYKKRATPQA